MGDFELEGGDLVSSLLQRYDRDLSSWSLPREGEFWDAVALAHRLGRRGSGCRIAVIDGGFDLTIPALLKQRHMNSTDAEPAAHGSVVALLVHEVAPESDLFLYTTTRNGKVNMALLANAIHDATDRCVDVINLSLGSFLPLSEILNRDAYADLAKRAQQAVSEEDRKGLGIAVSEGARRLSAGWRHLLSDFPDNPVSDAVKRAIHRGITVAAASGNDVNAVSLPAALPHVFAIGFQNVGRTSGEGMQKAIGLPPTGYSQSRFNDFTVLQPQAVLGSSFATPMISGFAALMKDRTVLDAYRAMVCTADVASSLMAMGTFDEGWSPMAQTIDDLFLHAVRLDPHRHYDEASPKPCPECSYFAAFPYVNFGLWKFNWGDLSGAEPLLQTARSFAPANVDAAANLAMTIARRIDRDRGSMSIDEMTRWLREAAGHMEFAASCRPHHEPYRLRYLEFRVASQNPAEWHLSASV